MKVLLPTEDPLFASALVEFVARHRWPKNTEFHVIHIVEPILLDPASRLTFSALVSQTEHSVICQASKMVEQAAQELRAAVPGAQVMHEVRGGRVLPELLAAARNGRADLIIAGSHGRSGFNRLMLGSMSLALLNEASCPVLLVKPDDETLASWETLSTNSCTALSVSEIIASHCRKKENQQKEMHKILFCVDGEEVSTRLLNFIARHNWANDARFKIVSVLPPFWKIGFLPIPELDKMKTELLAKKAELVSRIADELKKMTNAAVEMEVIEADPKKALLDRAQEWKADLLVVGSQRLEAGKRNSLGSVSLFLLAAAPCSVLFLRDGQSEVEEALLHGAKLGAV